MSASMRSFRSSRSHWFAILALAAMVFPALQRPAIADDEGFKIQTILLWGTNDEKSPNPKHKPVDEETRKKLKQLPLKWTHYFEETRRILSLPQGTTRKEVLSRDCTIEVKNAGESRIEICFIGKGQHVVKQSQDLPKGETLVVAGNAPNATAWLVVIKRTE